jgi:hypothetical protein
MGRHDVRPCPCGSGKPSQWQYDGQGIELCRTCEDCHAAKMRRYNPRYLRHYTQADIDERIEPED